MGTFGRDHHEKRLVKDTLGFLPRIRLFIYWAIRIRAAWFAPAWVFRFVVHVSLSDGLAVY